MRKLATLGATALVLVACEGAAPQADVEDVEPTATEEQAQADDDFRTTGHEVYPQSCLSSLDVEEMQWHGCNGPGSVQFGQPGTDLRAFRMDCIDGEIGIAFPMDYQDGDRDPLIAEFGNGATREGEMIQLGDGSNFSTELDKSDPLVSALIEGELIEIGVGFSGIAVPTTDVSKAMMRELVAECRS